MKLLNQVLALSACAILISATARADEKPRTFVVDYGKLLGIEAPRIGFLGGLRDDTPDALVEALHPSMFRIGHQFRGRIAGGMPAAVDRVTKLGAVYKLVMSDLIGTGPRDGKDWSAYEAAVKKLVAQVGERAGSILWEPENEPDTGHKNIADYYQLYQHAFKALRESNGSLKVTGPSFAFPSYDKYKLFLDDCKANRLECNVLCWHYTGWDPAAPVNQKWHLEKLRELTTEYPDQKIGEVTCDEWGAGPKSPSEQKPGRLEPGRAVVWFYYLSEFYNVDRACRANWGGADDFLGGIITRQNETYPAYHAYRFYGSTIGMQRVAVTGNDATMAVLAHRAGDTDEFQILLGSVSAKTTSVRLELHGMPGKVADLAVRYLPNADLDKPMTEADVPVNRDFTVGEEHGAAIITLGKVKQNEAYELRFKAK